MELYGKRDFCPSRARSKEAEGTLSVGEATYGIIESPSLGDAAAQKKFTPIRWPNGGPEQFEGGGPIPVASWEAVWPKRLGRGAGRDDLGLAKVDDETDAAKTESKGGEEKAHGWCGACADAIIKIEGANVKSR